MTLDVNVLEQAKRVLQKQGWTRHQLVSCDTGEVCALGALNVALGVEVVTAQRLNKTVYDLRYPYQALEPTAAERAALGEYPVFGTEEEKRAWSFKADAVWSRYNQAETEFDATFEAYSELLAAAVRELSGGSYGNLPTWNDRENSTVQDVIDVFDTAIGYLKKENVNV